MSTESPRRDPRDSRGAVHRELAVVERHVASFCRVSCFFQNRGVKGCLLVSWDSRQARKYRASTLGNSNM